MKIKNYLWALPFFSFFAGYLFVQRISSIEQLQAPSIVGKQLQNAVAELSAKNLNLRFITQKEDPDLPQGTILSQTPCAGQNIKPHQSLYVVISKKPEKIAAPLLTKKSRTTIEKELLALGVRNKSYFLPSNAPTDSCIAQLPAFGNLLQEKKVITYISSGNKKPVLIPNFKNKSITDILEFLQKYEIKAEITHTSAKKIDHICDQNCIITNQRPLAGSIVTISPQNPTLIQLQAQ
ncbi:PASTA domain-containing protein [bacterium]|nr:PASTA domain-containing protein [bacterium]